MTRKKILGVLFLVAITIGGGYFGIQYYLDNIKLPDVAPAKVVDAYFSALQKQNFKAAYDMVSRIHYVDSINQFVDRTSMYAPDMKLSILGENIVEGAATVDVRIEVPLKFGLYKSDSTMDLVRVKREWKIMHP